MPAPQSLFARLLSAVFGNVQWQAPHWVQAMRRYRKAHPRLVLSLAVALLLTPLLYLAGYNYYLSLPQPAVTLIEATAPGPSAIGDDDKVYPEPIVLRFTTHYPDPTAEGPRNAAKLSLLGKTVSGISLSPAHAGTWTWQDENTLIFSSEDDWPAGQQYRIALPTDIFADGINLDSRTPSITTAAMQVAMDSLRFYQDPTAPSRHQTVATLTFSHAVNLDSLRQHVQFAMRPSGAPITTTPTAYPYTVKLGKAGREAYLSTEPLSLPDDENFMTLAVDAGIQSTQGPSKSEEALSKNVRIPSISTFFRVSTLDAEIVRNEQNDPEQTFILELTDAVQTEQLATEIQAWILPNNYREAANASVDEAVLKKSEPLTLTANPSEHAFSPFQSFRFRAPSGRRLYVRLPAGLTSQGKFVMTVPYSAVIRAPDFPKELNIVGNGGLLALKGDQKLSFQTRGVGGINVEITQLFEEQIVHLVSQTNGNLEDVSFKGWSFDEKNLGEQHKETLWLANKDPAKASYAALSLAPLLKNLSADKGVFVINAQGVNSDGVATGPSDRRLLIVSDMALISKRDADNESDVYVLSVSTGKPVANATISLIGLNGRPLITRTSDAQGHADFPNANNFEQGKQPAAWLVKQGDDLAFMPYEGHDRNVNFSRFDTGGIYTGSSRQRNSGDGAALIRAMVFSDRGIYRPGEQGHLAVMSKRDDWGQLPASPIEVVITDPRNNIFYQTRQRLPEDGMQEIPFTLSPTATTGEYRVAINLITNPKRNYKRRIGSGQFSVEEFQPDNMRIRTELVHSGQGTDKNAGWQTQLTLRGNASLQNLFGLPAQDRRVKASYTLQPRDFQFSRYADYQFENPYRLNDDALRRSVTEDLTEKNSDTEGNAQFDIDLSKYGNGLYQLSFEAEGFDTGGGRSVSAQSRALVSPLQVLIGSKSDGKLDYIQRNSERSIEFIAINPNLDSLDNDDLTLRITEVRHLSTLVKQRDGTLAYQTIDKHQPVSSESFRVVAGGSHWTVPTDKPGDFIVELISSNEQTMARRTFNVIGSKNIAGDLEKNAELQLKLDRADYRVGDTIEMQITAPYTGAGLITIERDKVFAHKWFRTDSERSVQSITVPEGIEGNAYVNVTFVRSLDSEEIFAQPMSVAVQPFNIDRSKRTLALEIEVPKKVKPGDKLSVNVTPSQRGKLIVFAINEGILQVANYQTPAPLNTFLQKRALQVSTQQIADMLLPEFSLLMQRSAAGGGAAKRAAAFAGQNLNPFQRGMKAPVVFWSGIIDMNNAGASTRVDFTVPDYFDGELRVMAVASNADSVGAAEASTIVRGPFILTPNVITAVSPGDEFNVSVGVANALLPDDLADHSVTKPNTMSRQSSPQTITVTAVADGLVNIIGDAHQSLTLAPGAEATATFRVKAGSKFGGSEIVFRAATAQHDVQHSVQRTATLSVRPAVPFRTTLESGVIDSGSAAVPLPRQLSDALSKQQVLSGYSPLVLADGLGKYLDTYPHGCSEQIISRALPIAALLSFSGASVNAAQGSDDITNHAAILNKFSNLAHTLAARQTPNGGFSYWPGSSRVDDYVSVYAMHFLLEAREQGLDIPRDVIDKGMDYLRGVAQGNVSSGAAISADHSREVQAYAIYILTRNGVVTTNYLTLLQTQLTQSAAKTWRASLTGVWMAASYKQLKLDELADGIMAEYEFAKPTAQYQWDLDSSLARNAQYLYLIARHFPAQLADIDNDTLATLVEPISKGQFNTLSASWSILALGAWGSQAEKAQPGALEILAQANANVINGVADPALHPAPATQPTSLARSQPDQALVRAEVPTNTASLTLTGDKQQRFFYSLSQTGYDAALPTKEVKQGMEIVRVYLNDQGEQVTHATLGDELTVSLSVRALTGLRHPNVAIVDLLPGGFEVQRDSIRGSAQSSSQRYWQSDYIDIREDRVVMYGTVDAQALPFTYRVKVTGSGEFVVPPPFAESMYHRDIQAQGTAKTFTVSAP